MDIKVSVLASAAVFTCKIHRQSAVSPCLHMSISGANGIGSKRPEGIA